MDGAGEGGHHGAENREKEGVAGRRDNPSGYPSGVGETEGGSKASIVDLNPGGGRQGVGGGVELPQVIDTPGVEELPQGEETSGVTLEGGVVLGADERGQGVDKNSPDTQDA